MRIAVSSDMDEPVARQVVDELRHRGHTVLAYGALRPGDRKEWAWSAEAAARAVADGDADQAVVCCWTGTGASIAANKLPGVRAALCADAYTARGARKWNDANALALSLRSVSGGVLGEILDAWFESAASDAADDRDNVAHLTDLEAAPGAMSGAMSGAAGATSPEGA